MARPPTGAKVRFAPRNDEGATILGRPPLLPPFSRLPPYRSVSFARIGRSDACFASSLSGSDR